MNDYKIIEYGNLHKIKGTIRNLNGDVIDELCNASKS